MVKLGLTALGWDQPCLPKDYA